MKILLDKSVIRGTIAAPSSKSYTIRALVCAALAEGRSEILSPLGSADTVACKGVLEKLGITITEKADSWTVDGGRFVAPTEDLFCNESAATIRFMIAVSSLAPGICHLTAAPGLAKRPQEPLLAPLRQLGVECSTDPAAGTITVHGGTLKGGIAELPGNISSQYVSALLFIAPFAPSGTTIKLTTPLESWPYVEMTLGCLKSFGIEFQYSDDLTEFRAQKQAYQPAAYRVEGDWSSASYLLAMGALLGETKVENLKTDSLQADKKIFYYLKEMGANIETDGHIITTRKSKLHGIQADLTDCIDLLPTMGILAAVAEGVTELTGIERARIKESNRVTSVRENLERMGVSVTEEENRLLITGSPLHGAVIDSNNDHRIAMAFSLLGMIAGDTTIEGAECVAKTYPEFWDILGDIGGEVRKDG